MIAGTRRLRREVVGMSGFRVSSFPSPLSGADPCVAPPPVLVVKFGSFLGGVDVAGFVPDCATY